MNNPSPMSEETARATTEPRPRLSLAMIARDRADGLAKLLEQVASYVDEIVVVDAGGSKDDTVAVAKSFGAKVLVYTPETNPEGFYADVEERFAPYGIPGPYSGRQALADFSAPRNLAFEATTGDYILWLDSDDRLRGAEKLPWVVEQMAKSGIEAAFFEYEYEHDERGHCTLRQIRERIIKRGAGKWIQPIHEHIWGPSKGTLFTEVVVVHDRKVLERTQSVTGNLTIGSEHRDAVCFRNLKNILVYEEALAAEGKEMPFRFHFYEGVEMRMVNVDRAIDSFRKYITKTPWDEERACARHYIGQICEAQQKPGEAWDCFSGAAMDFPGNPAPWFGLARLSFVRGDWSAVIRFTETGLSHVGDAETQAKKPTLVLSPIEWTYRALLPYTRALIEVGRCEEALKHAQAGLEVNPDCAYLPIHVAMAQERLGLLEEKKSDLRKEKSEARASDDEIADLIPNRETKENHHGRSSL